MNYVYIHVHEVNTLVDAINKVTDKYQNQSVKKVNQDKKTEDLLFNYNADFNWFTDTEKECEDDKALQIKKNHIIQIISEDKNAPENADKEKIADYLIDAWKDTNVDFHALIAVAKQETHFTENASGNTGYGLMQITSIVAKDFYQRPGIYDKEFADLLKSEFGNSLENLFKTLDEKRGLTDELKILEAENKVPYANAGKFDEIMKKKSSEFSFVQEQKETGESFDELYNRMGKFGQLLYDNKNPEILMEAIRNDSALNCKVGAYRLKQAINASKGNIQKAFEDYNSTDIKESYAKIALSYYNNSKEIEKTNEKSLNVKM